MSKRLEMFDAMIAKGGNDPFVFYARAMELRSLGRREEALAAFEAVARDHAAYVPTYLMAGQVATELGREDDARRLLEAGIVVASAAGDAKAVSELRAALAELD